jgi:hypothetical protein
LRRASSFLSSLLILAGCTSGSLSIPEGTSKASAAVVRAWSPTVGKLTLVEVDRTPVGRYTHVYLAPGTHTLTLRWSNEQSITRLGQITVQLESRHSYVPEAEPDGALRTVKFILVDKGFEYPEDCLLQNNLGSGPKGRGC